MDHEAVVFGASGLVGGRIVELLLADPSWNRIRVIGKPVPGLTHRKLVQHPFELSDIDAWSKLAHGDVVFSALSGSRSERKYELDVARTTRRLGIPTYVMLSTAGADPANTFYFTRTRGELEGDIAALAFPRARFLRPAAIEGQLGTKTIALSLLHPLKRILPLNARPLSPTVIAAAALASAYNEFAGVRILETMDIYALGTARAIAQAS